jgi:hypothetical protein
MPHPCFYTLSGSSVFSRTVFQGFMKALILILVDGEPLYFLAAWFAAAPLSLFCWSWIFLCSRLVSCFVRLCNRDSYCNPLGCNLSSYLMDGKAPAVFSRDPTARSRVNGPADLCSSTFPLSVQFPMRAIDQVGVTIKVTFTELEADESDLHS